MCQESKANYWKIWWKIFSQRGEFSVLREKHAFERNVVIEFKSIKLSKECYNSKEYQEAKS